jgi:hypothetical protein
MNAVQITLNLGLPFALSWSKGESTGAAEIHFSAALA